MEGRHHHEHCHRCPRPHSAAVRRARHFHQPSRLAQRAAALKPEEHSLRQEPEPENSDDQAALRRSRHHTR